MPNFDEYKLAVEALSGGKNTVLFDDVGMPSVMVPIPKFKISDVIENGSENIHPAFIVDGVEKDVIYVSKFLNVVENNRGYSLPGKDPTTNADTDKALTYGRNKGNGWCSMPTSLWAAIALWCRKNGTIPRGNSNHKGGDDVYPFETAIPTTIDESKRVMHTATGTGPNTWNHNWQPDGIADLKGNVWEKTSGFRLMDGEIQVIPDGNMFNPEVSCAENSTAWKAIHKDGNYVNPGSTGTLKYDWVSSTLILTAGSVTDTEDVTRSSKFGEIGLQTGLVVPEKAVCWLIYPEEPTGEYGGATRWARLTGERLPRCGGRWYGGVTSDIFTIYTEDQRSTKTNDYGFRTAFCEL